MTRTEAIAILNTKLASLNDEQVTALTEIAEDMDTHATWPLRDLSTRELSLLEQSKADFAAGRTYSHEEAIALLDERMAVKGVPKSTA